MREIFWRTMLERHPSECLERQFHSLPRYPKWADVPLWKKVATYFLDWLSDWADHKMMRMGTYW